MVFLIYILLLLFYKKKNTKKRKHNITFKMIESNMDIEMYTECTPVSSALTLLGITVASSFGLGYVIGNNIPHY